MSKKIKSFRAEDVENFVSLWIKSCYYFELLNDFLLMSVWGATNLSVGNVTKVLLS